MREILFRGKRIDNGEWAYGYYTKGFLNPGWEQLKDKIYIFSGGPKHYDFDYAVVSPETVGQFTGLTDRNGKKIFDGDIVEHHAQGDIIVNRGVVNWDVKNARWAYQLNTMNPCFTFYNPNAFEVVGNIHDNPELLTEATP